MRPKRKAKRYFKNAIWKLSFKNSGQYLMGWSFRKRNWERTDNRTKEREKEGIEERDKRKIEAAQQQRQRIIKIQIKEELLAYDWKEGKLPIKDLVNKLKLKNYFKNAEITERTGLKKKEKVTRKRRIKAREIIRRMRYKKEKNKCK